MMLFCDKIEIMTTDNKIALAVIGCVMFLFFWLGVFVYNDVQNKETIKNMCFPYLVVTTFELQGVDYVLCGNHQIKKIETNQDETKKLKGTKNDNRIF